MKSMPSSSSSKVCKLNWVMVSDFSRLGQDLKWVFRATGLFFSLLPQYWHCWLFCLKLLKLEVWFNFILLLNAVLWNDTSLGLFFFTNEITTGFEIVLSAILWSLTAFFWLGCFLRRILSPGVMWATTQPICSEVSSLQSESCFLSRILSPGVTWLIRWLWMADKQKERDFFMLWAKLRPLANRFWLGSSIISFDWRKRTSSRKKVRDFGLDFWWKPKTRQIKKCQKRVTVYSNNEDWRNSRQIKRC